MLFIYIFVVLHTVLADDGQVFYNIDDAESHFQQFALKYNKTYESELEKAARFEIFKNNIAQINEMNQNDPNSPFAVNHFADLSSEEFIHKYTGLRLELAPTGFQACKEMDDSDFDMEVPIPDAFDWRNYIEIQPKSQEVCGSCYAFSATGTVETQYAIKYNKTISLSVQQIVDCDTLDRACEGGFPAQALRYLIQNGGQTTEKIYPYVGITQACHYIPGSAQVKVEDCTSFRLSTEDVMRRALFLFGPLSIALDARSLQAYHGGDILTNCEYKLLSHAVLLVGYGTDDNGNDFWVIRNSWSSQWGDNGFGKIARGVNACGILNPYISASKLA